MSNGKNGFGMYEDACDEVWAYKLQVSFATIKNRVAANCDKFLVTPNFYINPNINRKWGSWSPSDRVMTFSASLLRNYEWAAVEYVMKHEVAHQIVSEIFGMDCYGVSHGEAWARACKLVGIEPVRCSSASYLASFKGNEESPMVSKVAKLLVHANDSGCTEAEASTFMAKAQELMIRHNIDLGDVTGANRVWISRPFGGNYTNRKWPSYMWALGHLLSENYNVKSIRTYGRNEEGQSTHRLELFGEPDNLDIAEYVGHALLVQADRLYEEFKKTTAAKNKEDREAQKREGWRYGRQSRISKKAFMAGLISSYADKLSKDHQVVIDKIEAEDQAVVPTYDTGLLSEMYGKEYPRLKNISLSGSSGGGYRAGSKAGSSLTLAKGVKRGSARRLSLTA